MHPCCCSSPIRLAAAWFATARRVGLLVALWLMPPPGLAQNADVTITGGADVTGQNYTWTITNQGALPIVAIEFPHYNADTFHYPPGWTPDCTNLQQAGARDLPGVCRATVETGRKGIEPGASAEFGMRLAKVGALRRAGKVTVRFSDNSELIVGGVELPSPPTRSEQYELLVGLALVFALLLGIHAWRRRRAGTERPPGRDAA